jgi:D-amino peptidase
MLIALSVDMEGVSQLGEAREILACCPEYWESGKPRLEADVSAACEGLLLGGASEVVVLDNHGSGNALNVWAESLPDGARLEEWNVFDLGEHGVDAMFQVGYHARGGVEGFLSHTYVPGLRLRVGDELISESHGRIWAAGVPLLGITGNDAHERTIGSLTGTPFLVVQESLGRGAMRPVFADPQDGLEAIRVFSGQCVREAESAPVIAAPSDIVFAASMPNAGNVATDMQAGGWQRTGEVEFAVQLDTWSDARAPLAVAMGAAIAPFMPNWVSGLATAQAAAESDRAKAQRLVDSIEAWAHDTEPEWFSSDSSGSAGT